MGSYRPDYQNYLPPPPPDLPPLPRGPPPPPSWSGSGDSYRPSDYSRYPQERVLQSSFSFRNSNYAPKYPQEQDLSRGYLQYAAQEQDYSRNVQPAPYARQNDIRPRARHNHRDDANLNRPRRGNYHNSQPYKVAPADRPLLRRHNDGGSSPDQMLEMATGQTKFMAADDVSDSEEEHVDQYNSEKENHEELGVLHAIDDEDAGEEASEPLAKRRAIATGARDGDNEPKWSNPDPYTVLPPLDDEQRKRKDVVRLIRKARKDADDAKTAEHNQVAANDDFISFGMDDEPARVEEAPSSLNAGWEDVSGVGVPGAPSQPRAFSHLQNLHNQNSGASATNDQIAVADGMGRMPGLAQVPIAPPGLPEQFVLDTVPSNGQDRLQDTQDDPLGNRKRSHNDVIKGASGKYMHSNKKGPNGKPTGNLLQHWVPSPLVDPTPWLQRTTLLTANTGFRLHKEICDFYEFVKPQQFEQIMRQELMSRLQHAVSDHIPHSSVHCFGSFAAGLYLPTADIDVVVVSNSYRSTGQQVICQSNAQMHRFGGFLEMSRLAAPGSVEVITGAKVPIIKFVDRITAIRIDVSFENNTGILANDTFALWKNQFPAMPILVTVVKQFLLMRGLNEVMTGGLGGFSVTCLVTSLLQNMPQVQSGELVPEQHLGEILLEFLDFYGNRLDTTRTGLMMHPPGYFDKRAQRNPAGRQSYNVSKADRLAIMDPNREDNDISGGSRQVLLIFDRFSKAHTEILKAMNAANRPSILDWSLAGNYESFVLQRNRLLDLYIERHGTPAGVPKRYKLPPQSGTGSPQDDTLSVNRSQGPIVQERRNFVDTAAGNGVAKGKLSSTLVTKTEPSHANQRNRIPTVNPQALNTGLRGGRLAPAHATGVASSHSNPPKPVSKLPQGPIDRANSLRKLFPNGKNVPLSVSKKEKKALVVRLTAEANAKKTGRPNKLELQATANGSQATPKAKRRAGVLKESYPEVLAGLIPDAISPSARKAFIEKHGEPRGAQAVIYEREPKPPRKVSTAAESLRREQDRHHDAQSSAVNHESARYPTRSSPHRALQSDQQIMETDRYPARVSNRMAPISDERRAEVVRNLSGTSQDDPIDLD